MDVLNEKRCKTKKFINYTILSFQPQIIKDIFTYEEKSLKIFDVINRKDYNFLIK